MNSFPDRLIAALEGRYRVERELGSGGMATVYLAHDRKHERQVAIKVLKPELAAVLGADRFVQEIKTTAQLQHPHILPLFDSGEAGGFLYYVMPYIRGETIRERLDRETQVGIEDGVRIATQVADALDYAHRQGVIHRDIKPENILLHDGRPMVMDFGIALAVSAAAGGRMTETGLSLGTPHYMSPEQATADKAITARSDVYSLASVLYEMLTGEPPHLGTSAQQIIMKIITEPVRPASSLRKTIPPHVSAALATGLEKLPADRFDSARAFAEALANPAYRGAGADAPRVARAGRGRKWYASPVPYAAALGLTLAAFAWQAARGWPATGATGPDSAPMRFVVKPPADGFAYDRFFNTAISADGRRIAFRSRSGAGRLVYVQDVGSLEARPLPGTEEARYFALSPDGRSLVFQPGTGGARRVAIAGGVVADLPLPADKSKMLPYGVTWSGHTIVLSLGSAGIVLVPDDGAPARAVNVLLSGRPCVCTRSQARLTPNGEHLLLAGRSLYLLPSAGGEVRDLGVPAQAVVAVRDGFVVYLSLEGTLLAAPLDVERGTLGQPVMLEGQVTPGSAPMVADNGTLVSFQGTANARLELVDVHGVGVPVVDPASVPPNPSFPRFSPDGRRIAITSYERRGGGNSNQPGVVSIVDVASGTTTRLTGEFHADRPEWSPDGQRVLFRRLEEAEEFWWQPYDRSRPPTVLQRDATQRIAEGTISPDGRWLLFRTLNPQTGRDIWYRAMSGSDTTPKPFEVTPYDELMPRFSPNGQWVAYESNESGSPEVFLRPFPGPGGRTQVSVGGGSEPIWAPDGRRLFYLAGTDLIAATVATEGGVRIVSREKLFSAGFLPGAIHANYDVARDGQHFLMTRAAGESIDLTVTLHWLADAQRRLGK